MKSFLYNVSLKEEGASLTITTPIGCMTSISKDNQIKTKISNGKITFKGLKTGDYTLTISDNDKIMSKKISIIADYSTDITFFSATIDITYPKGSLCTATNGKKTYNAPDSSGNWTLTIQDSGNWTFKAINGDCNDEKTLLITENGYKTTLKLDYNIIIENGIFKNGYSFMPTINNYSGTNATSSSTSSGYIAVYSTWGSGVYTKKIDFTNYKTLIIESSATSTDFSWMYYTISTNTSWYNKSTTNAVVYKSIGLHNRTIYTLDISGVKGSYYIKLYMFGIPINLNIYNMRLE